MHINDISISLKIKVDELTELYNFKKSLEDVKPIFPKYVEKIGSITSYFSKGWRVPGIEYFGSGDITSAAVKVGLMNQNLKQLDTKISAHLSECIQDIQNLQFKLREAVNEHNREIDRQKEEGTYLIGQKINVNNISTYKESEEIVSKVLSFYGW